MDKIGSDTIRKADKTTILFQIKELVFRLIGQPQTS